MALADYKCIDCGAVVERELPAMASVVQHVCRKRPNGSIVVGTMERVWSPIAIRTESSPSR